MSQQEHPGPAAVRAHLDRVLASSAFRSSHRCQEFLRYVVELKLAGRHDDLKERLIGTEVFGRTSSYDPSDDSIVRVNANDVRKRLAQYYMDSDSEIRIELQPGSYVPEFHLADSTPPKALALDQPKGLSPGRKLLIPAVALLTVVCLLSVALRGRISRKPALEQFWAPVTSGPGVPLILMGTGPAVILPLGKEVFTRAEILQVPNRHIATGDFLAAFAIATKLQHLGRDCQVRPGLSLSLEEMQTHPVIAVGAFNNAWTIQLNRDVRFMYQLHESPELREYRIIDKRQPERQWIVVAKDPLFPWKVDLDYAIVTRLIDPTTHQVFISAGGVTHLGTQAAGEFLATPSYWETVAAQAPRDWTLKNMQIVLEIRVVDDTAKPPVIVASYFW
jgi:hypothetical protein